MICYSKVCCTLEGKKKKPIHLSLIGFFSLIQQLPYKHGNDFLVAIDFETESKPTSWS